MKAKDLHNLESRRARSLKSLKFRKILFAENIYCIYMMVMVMDGIWNMGQAIVKCRCRGVKDRLAIFPIWDQIQISFVIRQFSHKFLILDRLPWHQCQCQRQCCCQRWKRPKTDANANAALILW